MKLSQQNNEPIPHEEKFGYRNSLEDDHWSDVATRIVVKAVAIVFFLFTFILAFKVL